MTTMSCSPRISILAFTSAPAAEQERGLLGWLTLDVYGVLQVDGVALRRTRDERLALSFPTRRDHTGRVRSVVRPMGDEARRALEGQILAELGLAEGAAS